MLKALLSTLSSFALVATLSVVGAPAASAAVRVYEGYQSCPAGQYIRIGGYVNGQQVLYFYVNDSYQGWDSASSVYTYNTLRRSGEWRVEGRDLESARSSCYSPTSGPASA